MVKVFLILFSAGSLYALGFPSWISRSLVITPVIGVGILLYFLYGSRSLKKKFIYLSCFNLGYNVIGLYWIAQTLQEFGGLVFGVAWVLSLLFTFIINPQLYAFLLFEHYSRRVKTKIPETFYMLILAFAYTFFEYFIPQQFQVMLGQPWIIFGQHLGLANVGGIAFYTFFSLIAIHEGLNLFNKKGLSKVNFLAVLGFILINPLLNLQETTSVAKPLKVRLVQANISNFLKVDAESGEYSSVEEVITRYKNLSTKGLAKESFDLIIWPETAYPYAIKRNEGAFENTILPTDLTDVAKKTKADLFVGGYDIVNNSENYFMSDYNTNFHLSSSGVLKNVYHKQILIPFGETLPFPEAINRYLSSKIPSISFFAVGEIFSVFKTQSEHSFINTICYEVLRPEFVRKYLNTINQRPHALINLTNDSWYGDTSEPEQHLFLTLWRAKEFNLPIIRSTNTGISTIIGINGEELVRLGVGVSGNLDYEIKLPIYKETIYQKLGFLSTFILFAFLFIFKLILLKFKRCKKQMP